MHSFLDEGHAFITDIASPVCGNTADMLGKTRFAKYFKVGERGQHKGLFDCSGTNSKCDTGSCC